MLDGHGEWPECHLENAAATCLDSVPRVSHCCILLP